MNKFIKWIKEWFTGLFMKEKVIQEKEKSEQEVIQEKKRKRSNFLRPKKL